ncbi:hypothetical protein SAMN05660690_2518 [Geodermatophilus telluris]|uniref:Uncharacterized protein n=1 Tax=Geodermatophilus telluris TaxID=1190417 RepID=A0A1G6PD84_9ACTN|nr:DUF6339 family protein [Geodermatophilus telluris]SDC78019.1 hypothetical protein SAMN05660690_2518 [Geodermatophilus telluris]
MSVLYPRLLGDAARELHRQYQHAPIAELQERHSLRHPSAVFAATGGRRVTAEELQRLRDDILVVAARAGFPDESRRQDRMTFDVEVAQLLHQRCGLVAAEASVRPMWAFLALVLLPDVSYWRYPRPPGDRVLGTDITRHVWGRLWWRAHLLALPQVHERYRLLETFGEAAFDQMYARRKSIGGSRALVRAIADVWPAVDRGRISERAMLIDVLKRLSRWGAVVDFESLDDDELRRQVLEAVTESAVLLGAQAQDAGPRHRRA